jgi:hypothetical protein
MGWCVFYKLKQLANCPTKHRKGVQKRGYSATLLYALSVFNYNYFD